MEIHIFACPYVLVFPMTPPALFKCLSDETRVRAALLVLQEGELCVCELVCALNDSQPKVSRHLAQLRACGLLVDRRQGQWVYYRLNPDLPSWIGEVLQATLQANAEWLQQDLDRLKRMGDRPVRAASCC